MSDAEEKLIQTVEVKQKLLSNPTANEYLNEFCAFLAGRLNEEITPIGFIMAFTIAAEDLDRGVDGYTGQPLQHRLARQRLGSICVLALPSVAAKVLPEDFAAEVKSEWRDLLASR